MATIVEQAKAQMAKSVESTKENFSRHSYRPQRIRRCSTVSPLIIMELRPR